MKRVLVTVILLLAVSAIFALEIGVVGGMEIGGRNRPFLGAKLGIGDSGIGISVEGFVPITAFETATEELQNVRFVEVDPFLLLILPLGSSRLYAGVAPILVYDIEAGKVGLFSDRIFHAKVGLSMGESLRIFVEGMTAVAYTPDSETMVQSTGIFSAHLGLSLAF
ncbi:MAG: hypothetical protein PWP37_1422 [Thermotogota bacterium]|nr:hypothetical protein [Thermotogota bacterium]MDK2865230.1 hypothetical protein [Thermotogota bacterium]